jgi:hypothetical protein
MSGEISPYVGRMLEKESRRASRVISRHRAGGQIRIGQVDTETDVAIAKVDAVTTATGYAMTAVVRVAQAQRQLEQLAPEASARLNFLADDHMLSMTDVMADLRRELRRA